MLSYIQVRCSNEVKFCNVFEAQSKWQQGILAAMCTRERVGFKREADPRFCV